MCDCDRPFVKVDGKYKLTSLSFSSGFNACPEYLCHAQGSILSVYPPSTSTIGSCLGSVAILLCFITVKQRLLNKVLRVEFKLGLGKKAA